MAITKLDPTKRYCRMGGEIIPSFEYYPTSWCWICLRSIVEREYPRTYYRGQKGHQEEAPELTGVSPFSEKGKARIKKVMEWYQTSGKITTSHE